MEKTETRKREYTYAVMTVIATFLVVAGHIGFTETPNNIISYNPENGAQHVLNIIIGIIYSFHMPLFFFVSGAVFGLVYNQKPYTFPDLLWKKTKRLIVPFYETRFLYMLPLKLLLGIYLLADLPAIVKNLVLLRDLDHLWFLIILFYIFIIAFFLRKYLFKFKIPVIILLLAGLALYDRVSWPALLNITFAYIIYFYLGLVFNEFQETITTKGALIMAVVGLAAYIVLYYKSEMFAGYGNAFLQKGMTLGYDLLRAILGIGVVYGVSKALCAAGAPNTKIFKGLYKHGFNIYLFHSTLNYVVLMGFERAGLFLWVNQNDLNAGLYILFRLAFTYLVPILISMGLYGVKKSVSDMIQRNEQNLQLMKENVMKRKEIFKLYWWVLPIFIVVVIVIPIIIDKIYFCYAGEPNSMFSASDILSFWGMVLSGIAVLAGVILTISHGNKKDKLFRIRSIKPILATRITQVEDNSFLDENQNFEYIKIIFAHERILIERGLATFYNLRNLFLQPIERYPNKLFMQPDEYKRRSFFQYKIENHGAESAIDIDVYINGDRLYNGLNISSGNSTTFKVIVEMLPEDTNEYSIRFSFDFSNIDRTVIYKAHETFVIYRDGNEFLRYKQSNEDLFNVTEESIDE